MCVFLGFFCDLFIPKIELNYIKFTNPIRGTQTRYTIVYIGLNQPLCVEPLDPEKDQMCSGLLPIEFKNGPLRFLQNKTNLKNNFMLGFNNIKFNKFPFLPCFLTIFSNSPMK